MEKIMPGFALPCIGRGNISEFMFRKTDKPSKAGLKLGPQPLAEIRSLALAVKLAKAVHLRRIFEIAVSYYRFGGFVYFPVCSLYGPKIEKYRSYRSSNPSLMQSSTSKRTQSPGFTTVLSENGGVSGICSKGN